MGLGHKPYRRWSGWGGSTILLAGVLIWTSQRRDSLGRSRSMLPWKSVEIWNVRNAILRFFGYVLGNASMNQKKGVRPHPLNPPPQTCPRAGPPPVQYMRWDWYCSDMNQGISFLLSGPFPTNVEFYKKLDAFIGPQLTNLANIVCEQSAKKQPR